MRGAVRRVGGLEIEDHACQIFERDEDQIAATVPFLIEGLREGNGILYLASAQSSKQVLEFLQGQGMDVQSCLNSGQLVVIGGDQAYQGEGLLDPDRLVSLFRDALESTHEKGFFDFRAIFDMNWACSLSSSDKVIEYIIKVDDFITKNRCLALCQYDRRRFPPKVLEPVIEMHPAVIIGREVFANARYIPPQTFSHPDANEARLNGIIDSLKRQKHGDDCQRELEKRLLLALDAAGLSIWDWDIAADRATWSGRLDERLGHVPDSSKHAQELLFKMVHPDDRKKVAQAAKRSLEEGADYESEFRLITADGETRWIFGKGKVIFDQTGKPSRMIGIGRDITEHKQMEQRLQESHEDMRALMNSTRDMISIIDLDGTILEINEYAAKVLGGRPEKLLGKNAFNYHPHKATSHKMFHLDKATQSAQTYRFEDEFNGLYFSHTFYPVKSEQGKTTRIVVVARDITDRKRAEVALRQSETRFKGIFESSPIGIEIYDPEGKLIHINRACMDIFGFVDIEDASDFNLFDDLSLPADAKESLLRGEMIRYETAFDFGKAKGLGSYETLKSGTIYIYVIISPLFLEGSKSPSNYLVQVQDITEHKASEEHLIALENKFSAAFQINPDPLAITDIASGKIIDINRSYEEVTSFSRDELIGRSAKELNLWVNPEERDRILRLLENGEEVRDQAVKFRKKNGDIRDVLFSARFITFADQCYLLSQAHDITERNQAEEALKERERKYREIVENTRDIIYSHSPDGTITFISPNISALGYIPEDVLGHKVLEFVHAEDIASVSHDFEKTLQEGGSFSTIFRLLKKDGSFIYVEEIGKPTWVDGKIIRVTGIIRDITDHRFMEEELAKENAFRQAIIGRAAEGIYVCHEIIGYPFLEFTVWNDRMIEITGYTMDEVNRLGWFQSVYADAEQQKRSEMRIARICGGKRLMGEEFEIARKDGQKRILSLSTTFLRSSEGPVHVLGMVQDITEKKKSEDDLKRYSEQLEVMVQERTDQLKKAERLAAIGETAAMIGHDLRNPLQSVYCMIYLARERLKSYKVAPTGGQIGLDDILDSIEESADYMNKIVSDIQDYARTMGLTLVKTDISFFIRETLSTIKIPNNVHVTVSVDEIVNELSIDLDKMKRIIINLMTNAINAMPDGGSISISVSKKGDLAKISVKDTGVGIPEEMLPKLFLPLFTTRSKGVGLGLSVCKRMVDAMGGKIAINSRVGEGTEAVIEIPVR